MISREDNKDYDSGKVNDYRNDADMNNRGLLSDNADEKSVNDSQNDSCYYNYEDDDISSLMPEDNPDPDDGKNRASAFGLFLRLFISPIQAWKKIKNSTLTAEQYAAGCLYPLIALASLAHFSTLFYDSTASIASILEGAIGVFISFFIGYFLVLAICRMFLPGDAKEKIDTDYGRKWLMSGMATLAVFFTIYELCPLIEPIVVFTPLFTIYAMLRGARFLRLKDSSESVVGWTVPLFCVVVPWGIDYLLEAILPSV